MKWDGGDLIKTGEIVWWNNFSCVGRIAKIIETEKSLSEWGLHEPGVFICWNLHGESMPCNIFYPRSSFFDNEIKPLSISELNSLEASIKKEALKPSCEKFEVTATPIQCNNSNILWKIKTC